MPDFVVYPHAALNRVAAPRPVDSAMLQAGERLLAAAQEAQAYGLAAAHLGENEPLVVMSMASDPAQRDYRLLFNPEIVAVAEETASGPEGSVSMPGIEVAVQRPVWAEIAYDDASGARHVERLEGFVARIALHEIEQANGMFFLSRVSRLKRAAATRKFDKSRRA
ncbi:Peptide deformylase [Devosia sp. LC5]|uniref:peptide deformylase n=1 Tax=Devosia sp. LC5 TaxID=1502724 RepID=UPI0004E42DA9|nr:peptide deformylase [Devosia sp. LC5]KFC72550.1 Peptide deformylase [Devosia sp. LC5]